MLRYLLTGLLFLVGSSLCQASSLRLLGRSVFPHEMAVGGTKLGGLSGISYDPASKTLWAISDDSANHGGPPRAYQLSLQLDKTGTLRAKIIDTLILRDESGRPFPVADCEGIACTGRGGIWVSSEGREGKKGAPPWLKLFSLASGKTVRTLPLPAVYRPADAKGDSVDVGSASQSSGVLSNKSLESCSLTPDLLTVYIANETSLGQEKLSGEGAGGAGLFNPTQVRISALRARDGQCLGQKLYISDAGCFFGSISDVSVLDRFGNLLVLERRIIKPQTGTGCVGIRIYEVNFNEKIATDCREFPKIVNKAVRPLGKTLVYDSRRENLEDLDNVEGLALMPLPGGRTGVVAIADDNFSDTQQTQILLYELTAKP